MPARVYTGANVVLYVNGFLIGRVSEFQWSSATPNIPIHGLDSSEAYELAPTTASCSGALTVYRTIGDGGAEGMGVGTQYPDVIREKYFTLLLLDRTTGATIFQASRSKLQNQSWTVAAKQIIAGTLTFSALEWNNEIAPAAQDAAPTPSALLAGSGF